MNLLRYTYLLFTLTLCSSSLYAVEDSNKTIRIVADHWKDYTNHDGTGAYIETIKKIYEPLGYSIDFRIMPFRRAVSRINLGDADILLAEEDMQHLVNSQLYNADNLLTPHQPIGISLVSAIFTENSQLNWQKIISNKNAKIAWIRGYDYKLTLNLPHKKSTLVNNSEQGLHLLVSGRIDCFIDDIEDAVIAQKTQGLDQLKFNYSVINGKALYPVYFKNKRGEELLAYYEKGMKKLINNGELQKLHERLKIPYPFHEKDYKKTPYLVPADSGFAPITQ